MSETFIPLSVPHLKGNELKYVSEAIDTEWVSTAGPFVERFETELASYVGMSSAVSCQNGTSGLHLALLLCDIQENDLVFAPALTFIAAVNPISYANAKPIFLDCDHSLCIDPIKLRTYCETQCKVSEEKLIHKETGKHIKAIVVVHVFGNMADMNSILAIAKEFHLKVIEDATEALGTHYTEGSLKGKFAGTMGDVGVYSFNGNKIMTTGGGGMLVSPHESWIEKAKHLSTQAKSDPLYYTHDEIGYNYRMTNLQAALGVAQLESLEGFISHKAENYALYQEGIASIEGLELLPFSEQIRSNYWFYSLDCRDFSKNRDQVIALCGEKKIQCRPIWGLICHQKPYVNSICDSVDCATDYWKHIVNIPCSSNLSKEEVKRVLTVLEEIGV